MKHIRKTVLRIILILFFIPVLAIAALLSYKTYYQNSRQSMETKSKVSSSQDISRSSERKEQVMIKWSDVLRYADKGNPKPDSVVTKSDAEWRAQLTPDQYRITRQKGTERAYSSEMCSLFEPGLYACICCNTLLFDSEEKFESGTGWPSFTQPIKENAIAYHTDTSLGMERIETLCNTCGSHLGHVFPDGPGPGGLRFCINAVALKKVKK